MRICVAQTIPVKGDIQKNIDNHKKIIGVAVANSVDVIVFPELSITGYEPELADELATDQDDSRFDDFQRLADASQIIIGVGMPIRNQVTICIGMILFQPDKARQTYYKQYLHPDEDAFFSSGQASINLLGDNINIALAICYELSVPQHSEHAFKWGANVYIASVAKSAEGVDKAIKTLADIAKKYSMTVLMANCIGQSSGFVSAGKSSVLTNQGVLVGQLNGTTEGILLIDTDTQELIIA